MYKMNIKYNIFNLTFTVILIFVAINAQNIDVASEIQESEFENLQSIEEFQVKDTSYTKSISQTFYLDYGFFVNAYAIELIDENNNSKSLETIDQEDELQSEILNGCIATNRDINFEINFILEISQNQGKTSSNQDNSWQTPLQYHSYIDLSIDLENQQMYIFDTDFSFQQLSYELYKHNIKSMGLNKGGIKSISNYLDFGNTERKNADKFIKVITYQQKTYAFTKYGAVFFENQKSMSDITINKLGGYKERYTIEAIDVLNDNLFIAVGEDGLDHYKFQNDGNLIFLKTYTDFNVENEDVVDPNTNLALFFIKDVKTDSDNNYIYVLDNQSGLHFIPLISNTGIIDLDHQDRFVIPFTNGYKFDYFLNTFIVLVEFFSVDYGFEYYVDIDNQKWVINNQYYHDLTIHDVIVQEEYAILLSDTAHRVVYHSIFQQYTNRFTEHYDYFTDPYIRAIKMIELEPDYTTQKRGKEYYDSHYLVGIRFDGVNIHRIKRSTPLVTCHASYPIQQSYTLMMNSTICPNKLYGEQLNQKLDRTNIDIFHQCRSTHKFTVEFLDNQISIQEEEGSILVAVLIIIFVLLLFLACFCWYKYQHKKNMEIQKKRNEDLEMRGTKAEQNLERYQKKKLEQDSIKQQHQLFQLQQDAQQMQPVQQKPILQSKENNINGGYQQVDDDIDSNYLQDEKDYKNVQYQQQQQQQQEQQGFDHLRQSQSTTDGFQKQQNNDNNNGNDDNNINNDNKLEYDINFDDDEEEETGNQGDNQFGLQDQYQEQEQQIQIQEGNGQQEEQLEEFD